MGSGETARAVVAELRETDHYADQLRIITAALQAAVAQERERCAIYKAALEKIGQDNTYGSMWMWKEARDALRRGEEARG
jgi:hypothetical protein